jgi:hypothetical protein
MTWIKRPDSAVRAGRVQARLIWIKVRHCTRCYPIDTENNVMAGNAG